MEEESVTRLRGPSRQGIGHAFGTDDAKVLLLAVVGVEKLDELEQWPWEWFGEAVHILSLVENAAEGREVGAWAKNGIEQRKLQWL